MTHTDPRSAFEDSNLVDRVSVNDRKISNVRLDSGRAEITRLFRFAVNTAQNQVHIAGLPNVIGQRNSQASNMNFMKANPSFIITF